MAKKKEETAVAVAHDYGQYSGSGYEEVTGQDMVLPYLQQLQALSPEVEGDDPIDGARPGHFLNTGTQELHTEGVPFVIAKIRKSYIEWVPRDQGGGFVGAHDVDSEVVRAAKQGGAFKDLRTPEGNSLVETAYLFCVGVTEDGSEATTPFIISLAKTKLKAFRGLMTRMRTVKGAPPCFAFLWRIESVGDKNKKGQPFKNVTFKPLLGSVEESMLAPSSEVFQAAVKFRDEVDSGTAKVDHSGGNSSTTSGSGDVPSDVPF